MKIFYIIFLMSFFTEIQANLSLINSITSPDQNAFNKNDIINRLEKLKNLKQIHREEKELEQSIEELGATHLYEKFFLSDKLPGQQELSAITYNTPAERLAILKKCKEEISFYPRIAELDLNTKYFELFPKESHNALRINRFASDETLESATDILFINKQAIKDYRELYKSYQELSHAVSNYDSYLEN